MCDKTMMVPCWIEKEKCKVAECNQFCRPKFDNEVPPNRVVMGHVSNKKPTEYFSKETANCEDCNSEFEALLNIVSGEKKEESCPKCTDWLNKELEVDHMVTAVVPCIGEDCDNVFYTYQSTIDGMPDQHTCDDCNDEHDLDKHGF